MDAKLHPTVEFLVIDERLHSWGLPGFQSEMAAAVDLFACVDQDVLLEPGSTATLIPAGFAMHIANPYVMALIAPRSGMGHKKGLILGNTVGVIDADYTGQIFVSAWNRNAAGSEPIRIQAGERIAQLMFVPILRPQFQVVTAFSGSSERGASGFGSTGAK